MMPVRKETGIAMPMKIEARPPSTNSMMTKTRITAVTTLFCRSFSIWRMNLDWSWMKPTWSCAGQPFWSLATAAFTPSTVSIRLAPARLVTSTTTAGLPSTRVIEVASLKVGRILATSPSFTDDLLEAATGMLRTSSGVSISAGTLIAKRPCSPSSAPAATRLLPVAEA